MSGDNQDLAVLVRTIPDYPKPGILFRDISTLMCDGPAFRQTIDRMVDALADARFDLIAGIEARGFIFAAALAYKLGVGTLMLRKHGKLPGDRVGVEYELEYGTDRIEMHVDACSAGHRILLVDDLIATGGTALAAVKLLRGNGAKVDMAAFVIDLPDLGGAAKLQAEDVTVRSLIAFPGH
jgi:adenine phosphoribosyltransferase